MTIPQHEDSPERPATAAFGWRLRLATAIDVVSDLLIENKLAGFSRVGRSNADQFLNPDVPASRHGASERQERFSSRLNHGR
jgi:hypothetical protein